MSHRLTIAIMLIAALGSTAAYAGCAKPKTDLVIPDGSKASREQLEAAHTKFVAYDQKVMNYLDCLDKQERKEMKPGGKTLSDAKQQKIDARYQVMRNAVTHREQGLAKQLRVQVRAFNTKAKAKAKASSSH